MEYKGKFISGANVEHDAKYGICRLHFVSVVFVCWISVCSMCDM